MSTSHITNQLSEPILSGSGYRATGLRRQSESLPAALDLAEAQAAKVKAEADAKAKAAADAKAARKQANRVPRRGWQ